MIYCRFLTVFQLIIYILILSHSNGYPQVRGITDTTIKLGAIIDKTGPSAGDIGLPITEAIKIYINNISLHNSRTVLLSLDMFNDVRYNLLSQGG